MESAQRVQATDGRALAEASRRRRPGGGLVEEIADGLAPLHRARVAPRAVPALGHEVDDVDVQGRSVVGELEELGCPWVRRRRLEEVGERNCGEHPRSAVRARRDGRRLQLLGQSTRDTASSASRISSLPSSSTNTKRRGPCDHGRRSLLRDSARRSGGASWGCRDEPTAMARSSASASSWRSPSASGCSRWTRPRRAPSHPTARRPCTARALHTSSEMTSPA